MGAYERVGLCILVGIMIVASDPIMAAQPAESGFEITTFVSGLEEPVALAFAPDGRLFVAEKGGRVRLVVAGRIADTPFVTLEVNTFIESGLLGLALDPAFEQNRYVYLFATISNDEQEITRYTDSNGISMGRTVIRPHLPSRGVFHNGGCLKFGPDGKLYFSIGDNAISNAAQDMNTLAGKICRIQLDGTTPTDNPFRTPTGSPRAIFALGFRNPFRFCFAPDGRMFAIDVGSDLFQRREEINLVRAGGNYGWPVLEGIAAPGAFPEFDNPIYAYTDKGSAPTGIVYYSGSQFPAEYQGNLFHLDHTANRVFRVELDGDRVARHSLFVRGEGAPVDLIQGPDGCLYYCELIGGEVKRICFAGDNGSPPLPGPPRDPIIVDPPPIPMCGAGAPLMMLIGAALIVSLTRPGRASYR
ncbi:MAG: PQQ-dependent sugar dehydrogenase [Phycisphaerae bacterium]